MMLRIFLSALGVALWLGAMSSQAQSKMPVEPDEGGIGGTGNSIVPVQKPDLIERPELPERIERIEPIDISPPELLTPESVDTGGSIEVDPPVVDQPVVDQPN